MPPHWKKFIKDQGLAGRETEIPESADLSGVGACIEWLDDEGSRSEREDLYPGIAVAKLGYIPVGGCSIGTGDPYFIREADGEGGALYRIYHDEVREDGFVSQQAIAVVLPDYRLVAKFKNA
ncbi:hypothetical protein [Prosthecobacter sp.]|uniref:hypothetical protein n=1 Tax=Prosthecobacter sp. TaxID=1965333 RepID=UPI002ABA6B90|nr:hypothetical protein [Prosthecobacter sp.]MDZ4406127.1 hypothetical protein [Prosthecobacter sp.]